MSRFAHHNPEDYEAAMEALVDRADFAKTRRREARFSETWCSQCGTAFGPGDHGYSHCIDHRSPEAALDIATAELRAAEQHFTRIGNRAQHWARVFANSPDTESRWVDIRNHARHRARAIGNALDKIAALAPAPGETNG